MDTLRGFLIGFVLFMGVMIGIGGLLTSMGGTYNVAVNDSFVNTYNKLDDMTGETQAVKDQVAGSTVDTEATEWSSTGILRAIKLPFDTIGLVHSLMIDVVDSLHFPHWVVSVIYMALLIIPITFIVVSALARSKL